MNRRMGLLAAGGLAVALVAGGGTALAAASGPESSSGVITGCYTNAAVNGSHAVVLQNGGTSCPSGTSAISWDQTGSQGPPGPAGTNGTDGTNGTNGVSPAVVPFTGTEGSCTSGGDAITDANDVTTYVCNGPAGTNGTSGTSIMTSEGFPPSPCTPGDTDIELISGDGSGNGEVLTCNLSGNGWNDTGSSIEGPQGPQGLAGTGGSLGCTYPGGAAGTVQTSTTTTGTVTLTCDNPNATHSTGLDFNGVLVTYTDANDPLGIPGQPSTYNLEMASLAVTAYQNQPGLADVTGELQDEVCGNGYAWALIDGSTDTTWDWQYSGSLAGYVTQGTWDPSTDTLNADSCPTAASPTWN